MIVLFAMPSAIRAGLPDTAPETVGLSAEKLAEIEPAIREAMEKKQIPGAVVLVGRQGKIGYAKAFGDRSLEPDREPMTRDTIFDLASLTKPVAVATAAMILLEQNKLRLDDPIVKYLPELDNHGKGAITIEHVLRHRAGFIADNPIEEYADGPAEAWKRIANSELIAKPNERFVYSDVGFIVLGKLVERVAGRPLDEFCQASIFKPLGMSDTEFAPREGHWPAEVERRIAPTTKEGGSFLRGRVHDPRARALGGIAGDAGLFGTADDLAVYAQMILDEGQSQGGARILAAETVRKMIDAADTPEKARRGLGWDIATGYSAPRGKRFGPRSFGHTGFTGTSLWIDPETKCFVILLTNRVHPDGKAPSPTALRARVGTIVAEAVIADPR
jgi:CubicO group peptidase (beta-lactamase class C family)